MMDQNMCPQGAQIIMLEEVNFHTLEAIQERKLNEDEK